MAYSKPSRNEQAALRPSKDPGNGAQTFKAHLAAAARGTRADLGVLQFRDQRGLLEVLQHLGVAENVLSVEGIGDMRELIEGCLPCRQQYACLSAVLHAGVGAGERIERGGNHELQITLGQHYVRVLEVEDFALFCDANLTVEGIDRLRIDRTMSGAAAAPH